MIGQIEADISRSADGIRAVVDAVAAWHRSSRRRGAIGFECPWCGKRTPYKRVGWVCEECKRNHLNGEWSPCDARRGS